MFICPEITPLSPQAARHPLDTQHTILTSTMLTPETRELARYFGHGNISAGLRFALYALAESQGILDKDEVAQRLLEALPQHDIDELK